MYQWSGVEVAPNGDLVVANTGDNAVRSATRFGRDRHVCVLRCTD